MNCHNPRVKDFNVVARTPQGTHRLLKVLFGPDGSIYVTFPGATTSDGIAAILTTTSDEQYYNINNTAWQGQLNVHSHTTVRSFRYGFTRSRK